MSQAIAVDMSQLNLRRKMKKCSNCKKEKPVSFYVIVEETTLPDIDLDALANLGCELMK